jgi:hypothetical protein
MSAWLTCLDCGAEATGVAGLSLAEEYCVFCHMDKGTLGTIEGFRTVTEEKK